MFKWLSNYRKRSRRENYNNGFDYAAGTLLRKDMTDTELTSYFYDSELDSFDHGVIDAINKLTKLGFIEKE